MNKTNIPLWAVFVVLLLLMWASYMSLWMFDWYNVALAGLAAASVAVGALLVVRTKHRVRSLSLVITGLIIGHWWLIEILLARAIWTARDFGP
jgi:hypothetical protein